MSTDALWSELAERYDEIRKLSYLQGVASWDQQTYMPAGSAGSRGELQAFLSKLSHQRWVDPRLGELIEALQEQQQQLPGPQRAGLRNIARAWRVAARVPSELAERLARLQSEGFAAWIAAREAADFSVLQPVLTELVAAVGQRAEAIADGKDTYAAMIDEYDPGVTPESLDAIFAALRSGLVPLLDGIRGAEPIEAPLGSFDAAGQLHLATAVAEALGFDRSVGRIDQSEHPFTVTVGARDVRFTTKVDPDDLMLVLGGTIHETGHALYEQGLPRGQAGISEAASMGLHESQSRFWENLIGRSRAFCGWLQGPLSELYGDVPDAESLYRAANRVAPGPIRIKADEVTYNLHIGVRFELERQLFSGALTVADLPEAWRAAYARDLGIETGDPLQGVLQDVHWASGAFGYFPSYTLGNLYAASLGRALREQIPTLWEHVGAGDFGVVVAWLREHIHQHGHLQEAPDLVQAVTGERDRVADLLDHLWERHGALYGLSRPAST